MEVQIGKVCHEGEHPSIDEDGGEDGDDGGVGGGVEDDPEDDEQALFDPQTDQQPFLPRFLDERTSDTEYPLKDYYHPNVPHSFKGSGKHTGVYQSFDHV